MTRRARPSPALLLAVSAAAAVAGGGAWQGREAHRASAASASTSAASAPVAVTVTVSPNQAASTSPMRGRHHSPVGVNLDWHLDDEEAPAWINASVAKLPLDDDPVLIGLARELGGGGGILRVGGSEANYVVYDLPGFESDCGDVKPGLCFDMDSWRRVATFAERAGLSLAFGLNFSFRRGPGGKDAGGGDVVANTTNMEAFMSYTAREGLPVYAFELGNEIADKSAAVMAENAAALRSLLLKYWPDDSDRPLLVALDDNPHHDFYTDFLSRAGHLLDVVTYHQYSGYGLDPSLIDKIDTPAFLDEGLGEAVWYNSARNAHAPQAELWIGETAAAWHSGRQNATDAWASALWYLDALCGAARANHTALCRQTLVGGWYELLSSGKDRDRPRFAPNPDYWIALAYSRLMVGPGVLVANSSMPEVLRVYAHCAPTKGTMKGDGRLFEPPVGRDLSENDLVVALINILPDEVVAVEVPQPQPPLEPQPPQPRRAAAMAATEEEKENITEDGRRHIRCNGGTEGTGVRGRGTPTLVLTPTRLEWHISSLTGRPDGRDVTVNGIPAFADGAVLPRIPPLEVGAADAGGVTVPSPPMPPVVMAPLSIAFVIVPGAAGKACQNVDVAAAIKTGTPTA